MIDQPESPATGGGVEDVLKRLYWAGMRIGARTSRDPASDDLDAALPACLAALSRTEGGVDVIEGEGRRWEIPRRTEGGDSVLVPREVVEEIAAAFASYPPKITTRQANALKALAAAPAAPADVGGGVFRELIAEIVADWDDDRLLVGDLLEDIICRCRAALASRPAVEEKLVEALRNAKQMLLAWMVIAEASDEAIEEALAPIEAALKETGDG